MAKIMLTLEDIKDADGNPGLSIDWDGDEKDDGGAAFHYATEFVAYLLMIAKQSATFDKDGSGTPPPDTSTLN